MARILEAKFTSRVLEDLLARRGLVEPRKRIGCGGEHVNRRNCSFDVLVEDAGAPDHDDRKRLARCRAR